MNRIKLSISTYLRFRFSILIIIIVFLASLFSVIPSSFSAEVAIGWDPVVDPELAGYVVYYKTGLSSTSYDGTGLDQGDSGIRIPVESLATPDSPTYALTGLQEGETYYFVVTAFNTSGYESGYSNEIMYTPIPPVVTYRITASNGVNGRITPGGTTPVTQGENQTYVISPDPNYHIADVQVDGVSVGPVAEYTFSNVTSDHTIYAGFEVDSYSVPRTIDASCGANGSISPAGLINVVEGSDITFQIVPDTNYHITEVLVDGASAGAVGMYTFSHVTADHTITAAFDINSYVITASSGFNGSISPTGRVSVDHGGSQTFTITPEAGYQVGQLTIDGAPAAPESSYSFTHVTADHSISVSFVSNPHTITASAGDNGSISPAGSVPVEHGSSQTFTISADPNYSIADVQVDGASVGAVTSYTFADVTADHSLSALFTPENQAPIADAGPDQLVEPGMAVSLTGSNSIDLDDGIASFQWKQLSGPPVDLSFDPVEPDAAFVVPDSLESGASFTFEVTVTDNGGLQSTDTCIVNASRSNTPPAADAGSDQTVGQGAAVTLDGSNSSDVDDGIVSYLWEQISGIPVSLTDPAAVQPGFISPENVGSDGAAMRFQVTVTDAGGLQSADTCIVNVSGSNTPPAADAGSDQAVEEGVTVTLDGSRSMDSDNGIALYLWKQTAGIPVTLSDPTAIHSTFTAPAGITKTQYMKFDLNTKDGGGLESSDSCMVQVSTPDIPKQPPKLTVSSLIIHLSKTGRNYKAVAEVIVVNDSGNVIEGALVTGNWMVNGQYLNSCSDSTNPEGAATLVSNPVKVRSSDVFQISITDISKEGFLYEPAGTFESTLTMR